MISARFFAWTAAAREARGLAAAAVSRAVRGWWFLPGEADQRGSRYFSGSTPTKSGESVAARPARMEPWTSP